MTASLDRRPSGDTSTGFSSVGLSPSSVGRTVGSTESPQSESTQWEDERPGTESPDLIDCSNGSNRQLGGLERQTGEAVSTQTGQTGGAVLTPTGRRQPESRKGSRCQSKGDGGRTSVTGGLTNTLQTMVHGVPVTPGPLRLVITGVMRRKNSLSNMGRVVAATNPWVVERMVIPKLENLMEGRVLINLRGDLTGRVATATNLGVNGLQ